MIICEAWVDRIAQTLDVPVHKIRVFHLLLSSFLFLCSFFLSFFSLFLVLISFIQELNFYQEGQKTHYEQLVINSRMDTLWKQVCFPSFRLLSLPLYYR